LGVVSVILSYAVQRVSRKVEWIIAVGDHWLPS
jgi:hypothetical protein